jgi:hypothetical protein
MLEHRTQRKMGSRFRDPTLVNTIQPRKMRLQQSSGVASASYGVCCICRLNK